MLATDFAYSKIGRCLQIASYFVYKLFFVYFVPLVVKCHGAHFSTLRTPRSPRLFMGY